MEDTYRRGTADHDVSHCQPLKGGPGCAAQAAAHAHRIFKRLRDEHGFAGDYTIVRDYVRALRRLTREAFVPLHHPSGHAQVDFGEAVVEVGTAAISFSSARAPATCAPIACKRARNAASEV